MDLGSLFTLCLSGLSLLLPEGFWTAWSLAPAISLPLAIVGILYAAGAAQTPALSRWRILAFAAGWLFLAVALVSPLCRLAATLASAHMVQHLILVAIAPPLLLLGDAGRVLRTALPHNFRLPPPGKPRPLIATAVYGVAIWFWHVPAFYEAALQSAVPHLAMVASLLAASSWFWRGLFATATAGSPALGNATVAALVTLIHTGVLGALLTFAGAPWYPLLAPGAVAWGIDPLADQQLAGLIMWVPMGGLFLAAALLVFATWLSQLGRESRHIAATATD